MRKLILFVGLVSIWCFIFAAILPLFNLTASTGSYSQQVDYQLSVLLYSLSLMMIKTSDTMTIENTAVFYAGITMITIAWFFKTNLKTSPEKGAANYICARCEQPLGRGLDYQIPCPRCGCTSYYTD